MNKELEEQNEIERPEHYCYGGVEPIEIIESWGLNFSLGNVLKYVCRAGKKNSSTKVKDLKKAAWYLDREIKKQGIN